MCGVWNEVREAFSLDWDNCGTYSPDNTNSMIGQCNSLVQKIQGEQSDRENFDFDCPCHLTHLWAEKGAKDL